ncbi:MAG: hypothetical protein K2N80_14375 [Lachnospiraceae bacterium]|nr:hypothetical protein [Lachnospiraceae bacterium]
MRKRMLCLSAILLIAVSLTGCKSTDYSDAVNAIENKEYETAFELLVNLGDYKDSKQLLVDNIKKYVSDLVEKDKYDNALEILDAYSTVSDFNDIYTDINEQKELYDTYLEMENCFSENRIEDGFALLDTLPSDYRSIQDIYNTYDQLKDTNFKGKHRDGSIGEVSQAIMFELYYSIYDHVFQLHVNKQIYWSDGTIYKEHDFYINPDDFEDETTIKYGSYTWSISDNGHLTEIEKGETYSYN